MHIRVPWSGLQSPPLAELGREEQRTDVQTRAAADRHITPLNYRSESQNDR